MADRSPIEWTDATWTPIRARHPATGKLGWHCEHASPGCANCCSETFNERRLGTGLPFKPGHRGDVEQFLDEAMLLAPLHWQRPRRIFVCSMTDLFGDWVPDPWIDRVFAVMALAPWHTFQVLTKRSVRMRDYLRHSETVERVGRAMRDRNPAVTCYENPSQDGPWPLENVWLGVSTEDQRRADDRVPHLLSTPAAVRFVSAEPLLGPVDLACLHHEGVVNIDALNGRHCVFAPYQGENPRLDWVIAGGESGPDARPMHPDWARSLRDQCAAARVPFHFKQWGAWGPGAGFEAELSARQAYLGEIQTLIIPGSRTIKLAIPTRFDDALGPALTLERYGKKLAGRRLDGVEHDGIPETRRA